MTGRPHIILASGSPRRQELLAQLGLRFKRQQTDVDETRKPGELPERYAARLAREKAAAGWRLGGGALPSLGADTIVVLDGRILAKPVDRADAERMLGALSGRRHEVLTAIAVAGADMMHHTVNRTHVTFAKMPQDWIRAYCATDEPMDKAGAYAIQGRAARYVARIDGSFSGVMGLPLYETSQLLSQAGVVF